MSKVQVAVFLAFLVLLPGCDAGGIKRDARDPNFARVTDGDAAMAAAIAKAKSTYPQFVAALRNRKPSYRDFAVKKPYATPSGGFEHMWIEDVKESEGAFEGIVANDPRDTLLVKNGQKIRFSSDEISDWKYVDSGLLVGGFTIRYFVDRMSPQEKAALEEQAGFRIR